MLSFEPSTFAFAPAGKLFFLGALVGAAKIGKSFGGIPISPSKEMNKR